jgi:hypothetical protein
MIRRLFENKFGRETPIRAGQEFTSVAQGLAIHALEILVEISSAIIRFRPVACSLDN